MKLDIESKVSQGYEMPDGAIGAGWALMKKDMGILIGAYVVMMIINMAASSVTGGLGGLVVGGPLMVGFQMMLFAIAQGRKADFGMLFDGFKFRFVQGMIWYIVWSLIIGIAFMLCIIPGFIVAPLLMLSLPMVTDGEEFWDSIQGSLKVSKAKFGGFFVLFILVVLLNLLGTLACGVGVLLTAPLTLAAYTYVYAEIFGIRHTYGIDPSTGEKDPNGPYGSEQGTPGSTVGAQPQPAQPAQPAEPKAEEKTEEKAEENKDEEKKED